MEKRKGLLAAGRKYRDIRTGFVMALHGWAMDHLQSHFLLLASVSLGEKLIMPAGKTDQ